MICRACAEAGDMVTQARRDPAPPVPLDRVIEAARLIHRERCATVREDGSTSPTLCDCQHDVGRKVTAETSDRA